MLFSVRDKKIILVLISLLFCYSCSYAAIAKIKLKSGKSVEGEVIEKTDKYIKIKYFGIPMPYYFAEIESFQDVEKVSPLTDLAGRDPIDSAIILVAEYFLEGKTDKAVKELEAELARDKNNFFFTRFLKLINDSAKGLVDKQHSLHFFKMIHYWRIKQYPGIVSEFQEALRIDSTQPFIYFVFATFSFELGKKEEAAKNIQKAKELYQINKDSTALEFIEKNIK